MLSVLDKIKEVLIFLREYRRHGRIVSTAYANQYTWEEVIEMEWIELVIEKESRSYWIKKDKTMVSQGPWYIHNDNQFRVRNCELNLKDTTRVLNRLCMQGYIEI